MVDRWRCETFGYARCCPVTISVLLDFLCASFVAQWFPCTTYDLHIPGHVSVISVHHLWFTHTWPCISDFCAPHSICISDFCAQHSIYTYLTMHQWFLRTTLDLHIPGRFTHSGPCINDFQAPHTITHTHTWFPRKRHNVYILMQYKLKTHGFRIVPCFGPHIWNSLPQDLRHCSTLSSFKAKLKTFLFSQYFHPN